MTSHVRTSSGAAITLGATATTRPASHAIRSVPGHGWPAAGEPPHRESGAAEKCQRQRQGDQFDGVHVGEGERSAGRQGRARERRPPRRRPNGSR